MNEQNKKAYKDIINKNISEECYETCPCCHDITITLDDGRIVSLCMSEKEAREIINNSVKFH